MDPFKTGKIIMNARKKCNMTQKELATKLFVSDKAVSKWERGLSFPDIALLIPLSDILNVNLYDLLKGEEMKEKQDDTILKETIKYSSEEKSKLKKFLISIIILMSIAIIIMFVIIVVAKLPKKEVYGEVIEPGEKFSEKNYVRVKKQATKELDDGWICKMTIDYPYENDQEKNQYNFNCLNIKYQELPGFNYYHLNGTLNKYYIDDTNFPNYAYNINYRSELDKIREYFNQKQFNKTISLDDLSDLDLKLIDKNVLQEVFNKTINSNIIDSYGNYPMAGCHVFNYTYTSYETGETYVVGYSLSYDGYIENVYIDLKYGNEYLSDLIKSSRIKDTTQYGNLQKIKNYILEKQQFAIPSELKNNPDAIELAKYNLKVITLLVTRNYGYTGNIIRYVKDEKEMVNQLKEETEYS